MRKKGKKKTEKSGRKCIKFMLHHEDDGRKEEYEQIMLHESLDELALATFLSWHKGALGKCPTTLGRSCPQTDTVALTLEH
jgi:hypothetical protein